jgi:Coenzyme PQQ synthesis protein D (PqqD)
MANQTSNFSFTVNPNAAASLHEDGIVILHTGKGCLFSSNGTGARIWLGVENQLSSQAIAEEISSEYQIAPNIAHQHTVNFLAELERQGLIQREATS